MIASSGGSGTTTWLIALVPTVSLAVAFVMAWAATYPQRKDRREQAATRKLREQRLDACADVVLGKDADPNTGKPREVGLAEKVHAQGERIEAVDRKIGVAKDGRPLAQVLEEALSTARTVGTAQREQAEIIEAQQETIVTHGRQIEAHERRLGRADERLNDHDRELRRREA